MKRRAVLIGGGEHAAVVADAVRAGSTDIELQGFLDPRGGSAQAIGIPWLGDDQVAATLGRPWALLCTGERAGPRARELVETLDPHVAGWLTVVHPTAWVSPTAEVGPGAVILAGAVVNARARVARHAIVNTGAIVEHDVHVGSFVHVGPAAAIGGGAVLEAGVVVGLAAAVRDHVTVGEGATVGMGAVVVADVAPSITVVGNPARPA